jgi:hypothetical protein
MGETTATYKVGNADFTHENVRGVTLTSQHSLATWGSSRPKVASPTTHALNDIMKGIRWSSYPTPVSVSLDDFDIGRTYKVQLFFMERSSRSTRVFDVRFNDRLVVKDFSPYYLQEYVVDGSRMSLLSHTFTASENVLEILLSSMEPWRENPILNAVTVEEVGYYCPAGSSYPKEAPQGQNAIGGTELTRSELKACSKGKVYFVFCPLANFISKGT